jgi:hypothetical protein
VRLLLSGRVFYDSAALVDPNVSTRGKVDAAIVIILTGAPGEGTAEKPGFSNKSNLFRGVLVHRKNIAKGNGLIYEVYGCTVQPMPAIQTFISRGLSATVNVTAVGLMYGVPPLPAHAVTIAWSCTVTVITTKVRGTRVVRVNSYIYKKANRTTFYSD